MRSKWPHFGILNALFNIQCTDDRAGFRKFEASKSGNSAQSDRQTSNTGDSDSFTKIPNMNESITSLNKVDTKDTERIQQIILKQRALFTIQVDRSLSLVYYITSDCV